MKVQDLAPLILEILNSPNTDLDTISAKRVRKQLVELRSNVTVEFVKENMEELNALITKIFRSLKNTAPDANNNGTSRVDSHDMAPSSVVNGKRKHGKDVEEDSERDNVHEDNAELSQSPTPPASKKAKKASHKLTDEEYARQLSSELNQRPSRSNRKSNGSLKKVSSRTPKKTKSRAKVDDSDDGSEDVDDHAKQRKPRARKSNGEARGGFAKELTLSEPLAAVVDATQLSRPQVVKRLWVYIKANDLQNPKNKKEILCDDSLRAIFNADKIDMFAMNKVLSQHLYEVE